MKEFFKNFVFGDEEPKKGTVRIETALSRVKFEAELQNLDDYNRAIKLLREERDILFPGGGMFEK